MVLGEKDWKPKAEEYCNDGQSAEEESEVDALRAIMKDEEEENLNNDEECSVVMGVKGDKVNKSKEDIISFFVEAHDANAKPERQDKKEHEKSVWSWMLGKDKAHRVKGEKESEQECVVG